jgi:tetratricopeptide (TPR) repeat protein
MFRLSRNILALFIVVLVSRPVWSSPTDEPGEMLARAEALYYEADFAKSVELLLRADELLQKQSGHLEEKIDVKMQLALGFMGLNKSDRAKDYLVDVYALDSDHRIDTQIYAPKVVRLAEEAKAEQAELRCRSLVDESQKQLGAGDSDTVAKLIGSNQAKCPALTALSPKAADLVFKEGLDAYRKDQMTVALQKFRTAVDLKPDHELARQYIELTERKVEVTAGHALLAWHKDFNAGEFALAARDYRELSSLNNSQEIEDVRAEYRQALSARVDTWSRACAMDDAATMERLRAQVNALLPEPSFGEDLLEKMKSCSPTSCIQMDSQFALTRLKNRVDPQFSPLVFSQVKVLPMTIRVNARIDVKGNVASGEMRGGDPVLYSAIRVAVDQWKFLPAVTEGGARCVDTEIPIVIHYAN